MVIQCQNDGLFYTIQCGDNSAKIKVMEYVHRSEG